MDAVQTPQVDEQAVRDILKATGQLADWRPQMIEAILDVLPEIEWGKLDEKEAVEQIAPVFARQRIPAYESACDEFEVMKFLRVLRELDYHINKEEVLRAALLKARQINESILCLRTMRNQVRQIFLALDERTKALFEIADTLSHLDGVLHRMGYSDIVCDLGTISVENLAGEEMQPLLKAYRMACDVLECED